MKFKGVVGAFFFIFLASTLALIIFVQTSAFGSLFTKVISDLSQKKAQAKVGIKNISISVFPPGIEFQKVSIAKKISDDEQFEAELGKVGFYVSLVEIEEKRLTFGQIVIVDSDIKYDFPRKDQETTRIDPKTIDKIFKISDKLPVRVDTLLVENTRIHANHEVLEAKRFKLTKKGKNFVARFHLANIKPLAERDFTFDEVWGDAEISRDGIVIQRLKLQHDVHTLMVKGKIKDYHLLKDSSLDLNGEGSVYLKSLNQDFQLPEFIKVKDGSAKLAFSVNVKERVVNGKLDLLLTDLKSNLLFADELKLQATVVGKSVSLNEVELKYKKQKLNLTSPVIIFENEKLLPNPINVEAENFSFQNTLRFLPKLKILKGRLTGKASIRVEGTNLHIKPQDNFTLRNVGLVVGPAEKKFTILMIQEAKLRDADFSLVNGVFSMTAAAALARSQLQITGSVSKEKVDFKVNDAKINYQDFGNIAKLDVVGEGNLNVAVSGPLDDVVINLKGKTKNFEILGYRLGTTDKNISIELKDSNVIIHTMDGKYGGTALTGSGSVNYEDMDIALGINSSSAAYPDLQQILHPIISKVDFLPADLDLKAKIDVDIYGKAKSGQVKVKSNVLFTDLNAYGESLNAGSFNVLLQDNVVSFKDVTASKGPGKLTGNFSFDLKEKFMKLGYRWDNFSLSTFNFSKLLHLNLEGKISGSIVGEGLVDNYLIKMSSRMFETNAQNHKFEDSDIKLDLMPKRIVGRLNFMGPIVSSTFDVSLTSDRLSELALSIDTGEIKPLAVAFFGQHLENEDFSGRLSLGLTSTFAQGFNNLNLEGSLKELFFKHDSFRVNYRSQGPEFIVKNSLIKSWNLSIKEPDLFVTTKGEGSFGTDVSLVHELHFSSKIAEILLAPVLSSEGFLRNIVRIDGKNGKYELSVTAKSDGLDLSIDPLPFPINNLKYNFEYAGKRLMVQDLSSSLDNGSVSLKGDVFFDENEPDVNIKYILDRAEIPILGKSVINLSGEGIVLGNNMPYNVGGDLTVNKAQIINELNEFSSKTSILPQIKFLPKNQESALGKLITLNLNVKAENPIRITNSLMDVGLRGELRLTGNPSRPRAEGRLYSPVNASRVFFKNNEYFITNADFNFSPKKEISNPDFDVQALTTITNYKVYPKAYGDLERFNFDLSSDPALPRNSILSLIAFGYTDEIQASLDPNEQQNLNQVGVGSFVFDRFKITDILNRQFGLQVNLGTVFEQSQRDSLLAGRTQEGQGLGGVGRTNSATKIELKKRLDEALTLSVSSTVGGSLGQRQSMNLNYGLSKKVQLEGVYELRTNEEGEENINLNNSVGADIKFRWSFK
ncbi:MAG TPA: translocation/assembly module TamB domain-containing protein [Bacteriovoracaceae bacterium]|nr:translocation/assembly module TamB domain-containing protein [Bacteriovoracaceae bacterium]